MTPLPVLIRLDSAIQGGAAALANGEHARAVSLAIEAAHLAIGALGLALASAPRRMAGEHSARFRAHAAHLAAAELGVDMARALAALPAFPVLAVLTCAREVWGSLLQAGDVERDIGGERIRARNEADARRLAAMRPGELGAHLAACHARTMATLRGAA